MEDLHGARINNLDAGGADGDEISQVGAPTTRGQKTPLRLQFSGEPVQFRPCIQSRRIKTYPETGRQIGCLSIGQGTKAKAVLGTAATAGSGERVASARSQVSIGEAINYETHQQTSGRPD